MEKDIPFLFGFFDEYFFSSEFASSMDDMDFLAYLRKEKGFREGRIASSDHRDIESSEEHSITGSAVRNPFRDEGFLLLQAESSVPIPDGDDEGFRCEFETSRSPQGKTLILPFDSGYPIIADFRPRFLCMRSKSFHELAPRYMFESRIVLD